MVNLIKPAVLEGSMFVSYKPISVNMHNSDFKIIKCLLSNPRMQVADIAREASISTKTVKREKIILYNSPFSEICLLCK
jgi:predicted DNA-binding transcriptional regulator